MKETPPAGTKFEYHTVTFGADPELFIEDKDGRIMGSEEIIPPKGLYPGWGGSVVRDGVQVELHPQAEGCRANVSNYLSNCFKVLDKTLKEKNARINLSSRVRVSRKTMNALSEESKRLGCMPSNNIYPKTKPLQLMKAAQTSLIRSAGGHIHLGFPKNLVRIPQLVQLLDILVGIPCVMLDRDPEASLRRRYYGRAGEFREKPYGVEYRVLSNFWLKWYPLMSLIFSLSRFAVSMEIGFVGGQWGEKKRYYNFADGFLSNFDPKKIQRAINRNDKDAASQIWEVAVKLAKEIYNPDRYAESPLQPTNLKAFYRLVEDGIDKWIPKDPMSHWINKGDGHYCGWETTARDIVATQSDKIA